jgi:acetyl coenzyme A synthetase (ADP forming)-like protein
VAKNKKAVVELLERLRRENRHSLTAPEARAVCEAYGIALPAEGLARSPPEAARIARRIGFPVALKIVSPGILHKTEAGGVVLGLTSAAEVGKAFARIMANARKFDRKAELIGVQVQAMVSGGQEVIVGAVTDPSFGKLVAFGLGGILVEVMKDVTFRLAPVDRADALGMLDSVRGAAILEGVRGAKAVNRRALAALIANVSNLVTDFPAIAELDLNPVFASDKGAIAADVRILLDWNPAPARYRPGRDEILFAMKRIMRPRAVAVIGASAEDGKIGNSVMKNLIDGGYQGAIYPINPSLAEVLGRKAYKSVKDVPGEIDVAVFAIPAKLVARVLKEVGEKKIPGAVLIPSGFAETGNIEGQKELQAIGREYGVRLMGPNIYGYYYTPQDLCATFCTPYDYKGHVALSSQSGGIGMAIIGFSRSAKMGVSAIVGLGNKADLDEDDLLTFFEEDDETKIIAMHCEDLKDGRSFAEVARRVTKKKPVVMLKAGRTAQGARAAGSHTGALAGDDKVYDDILRECGVIRAPGLRDMLDYARGLEKLPTPKGENVVIITGAGGSGVLLSDACVDNGLQLMRMPPDLDQAFRKFIPPFGAAGNPIDITGGEPPSTYKNTIRLGLEEPRIDALILGYWHTIVTPPLVFANVMIEIVDEMKAKGIEKPIVASLAGDVEVEQAAELLYAHGIPAYPYTTEIPVAVLGAKYRWARGAGLIPARKRQAS